MARQTRADIERDRRSGRDARRAEASQEGKDWRTMTIVLTSQQVHELTQATKNPRTKRALRAAWNRAKT